MLLHSAPGHYDAIFMDIQMPLLNGNEAAALIRSSGRGFGADYCHDSQCFCGRCADVAAGGHERACGETD